MSLYIYGDAALRVSIWYFAIAIVAFIVLFVVEYAYLVFIKRLTRDIKFLRNEVYQARVMRDKIASEKR